MDSDWRCDYYHALDEQPAFHYPHSHGTVLPSIVCLVGSLAFLVNQVEEDGSLENSSLPVPSDLATRGNVVFWSGIASLLAVPVFAEFTGLPPYLAMLTGLGAMWTLTDIIHMGEEDGEALKVPAALSKLDTAGILFFLGILMSIGVLDKSGILKDLAVFLNDNLPSQDIIATVIGLASALIDNVPLVAATQFMYELADYGTDDRLWQLIALCAGTGGSILVIGSASKVALMGLEKVDFLVVCQEGICWCRRWILCWNCHISGTRCIVARKLVQQHCSRGHGRRRHGWYKCEWVILI